MTAYANLHLVFEQMRIRARRAERGAEPDPADNADDMGHEPPRVLVIGPEHSGKTTACKILTNYAVRGMAACAPLYIHLDPSEVSCASTGHFLQLLFHNLRGYRVVWLTVRKPGILIRNVGGFHDPWHPDGLSYRFPHPNFITC
jgi:hypothetical protein